MTNEQIIAVFKKAVAVLQVIDDGPFRVRAYQTAIETIENLDQELSWLIKQSDLKDLPGIGEELAKKIGDLIEAGESDELNRLFMKVPQHMFPLLSIPGVGAKKAYQLATTYPEVSPDKVLKFIKAKVQAGEVAKLPGWGAKSAEKLLINLDKVRGKATRMRLDQADEIANLVIEYLLSIEEVKAASPLGSIRRRRDTIGDLDIGVMASDRNQVLAALKRWDMVERVIAEGENLIRITLQGNKQVDVKFASEKDWGSTLQHFTGSKLHNIKLREYALKRDMSLSEHGIKTKGGLKTFTTEEKFYEYLGLRWVPPELREGQDEINLAKQDKLPRLVTLKDVKGDTHTHTDFKWISSHDYGAKVEDLLEVSQALGYEWLCLGDHNPAASKYSLQELVKLVKKRRK